VNPGVEAVVHSVEWAAVNEFYGDRRATRSERPLIEHIAEGLHVLDLIAADEVARLAFCIHPLCQDDVALGGFDVGVASTPRVLLMAVEYRNVANRYLAHHYGQPTREARLSPLGAVNQMLVADKVQNRWSFERYGGEFLPNGPRLAAYFREWLSVLGISEDTYQSLTNRLAL
jgi:hypothetical protein